MVEDFYGENRKTIYKLVLLLGTYEKVIYKLHFLIFDGKVIDVFFYIGTSIFELGSFHCQSTRGGTSSDSTPSGFVEQTKRW
jgi:hypothetical protein